MNNFYALTIIAMTIISTIFIFVNFIVFLIKGNIFTNRKLWVILQIWTVVILPLMFLSFLDWPFKNDCCSQNIAIFSPEHRIGIYILIILCSLAFVVNLIRKKILPPLVEVIINALLILGLLLNIILCNHLDDIWWLFGNIPIILLMLIMLAENHINLNIYIEQNEITPRNLIGTLCLYILKLRPFIKYPVLTILSIPILVLLSLFLILFGQKPDGFIKAFTDTYRQGFSQLDYECIGVDCGGGHFLCSVGANGHRTIVKPIRFGERNGNKIICNRQLLISNAFEDIIYENYPMVHRIIRKNYNKVGNLIHRHYYLFNNKFVSDFVYLLMKPLEIVFLMVLYTFDKKPENRIAIQYLTQVDREKINQIKNAKCEF